jgi:hypothetical protein
VRAQEQIQSYLEQPRRYFNIDGLGEIGIGVMMLGYALIGWLQVSTPRDSLWNGPYGVLALLGYVGLMALGIDRGTKFVKSRITYPRTGFVAYRRGARSYIVTLIVSGAGAAVFAFLAMKGRLNVAAVAGVVMVPAYAHGIARTVQWKWLIVGILAAGSLGIACVSPGWITSFAPASATSPKFLRDMMGSWLPEATFIGATMLVSGGITLYQYLRHTQAPDQASE